VSSLLPEGAGIVVGVGVGAAASAAIEPAVEVPKQEAWARNQNKILAATLMAALVAQGALELETGHASANREGYTDEKFDHLVYLAQTAPGASEALDLWRKGFISTDLYAHALTKAARDQRYVFTDDAYRLKELVGLGDVAYGVVRGILPAPSWVPVAPPTSGDKVPRFPQVDIDPLELAHKLGFNEDMLRLMVGRSGLSMAPTMAAQALFRGIIGPNDYLLAIAEGDLRTEWAEAVRETARQILTSDQYTEAALRGWIDVADLPGLTAKHGLSSEDTDLLYKIKGRPIVTHQITTGLARGGTYPSTYDDVPEPYQKSLRESNIRPEWASLAYANRYSYPSGFQIRAEAQAGRLTRDETNQILLEVGWSPHWAGHFADSWTGGTTTSGDPHVGKAQTQLWTATHKAYVNDRIDATAATTALETAGVTAASVPDVLRVWDAERDLVRAGLSAAQIKKAFHEAVLTVDEAVARLVELGWSTADAQTYLPL